MGISSEKAAAGAWVVAAGIQLRAPLKPICTAPAVEDERETASSQNDATTPTFEASRIPSKLACPPPPRKAKAAPNKRCSNGKKEFFATPPDLEAVFMRRHLGC